MKLFIIAIIFIFPFASHAGEINQSLTMLFGKGSHQLDPDYFDSVRTRAQLITPNITERTAYLNTSGNCTAVIIVTKIREDYPKDDSLLDKVESRNVAMQSHFGKEIVKLREVAKANPKVIELIFYNAEYTEYFPMGIGGSNLKPPFTELGISQKFVQNGIFVEAAMHFKRNKDEPLESFTLRCQQALNKWRSTIKVSLK